MNFLKSYTGIGMLMGQWRRPAVELGCRRTMCNKPMEKIPEPPAAAPAAPAARAGFKLPGFRPSPMDQKILIWSGRFKTPDQIPEFVTFEMIDAARNKVRVKACYVMMFATIGACIVTVIMGKRAAGRHESLTAQNMEKKARWREEAARERAEAAASLAEKAP